MRRSKGFSLLEIIVVVVVIGVLAVLAVQHFTRSIEKAQSVEALVYTGNIKTGQEIHKLMTGEYVALDDTEEINEVLNLGIKPKYYDFRVILPEEDKFLIIAQRIGEDIEALLAKGEVPMEPTLIVMSEAGIEKDGYELYLGWDEIEDGLPWKGFDRSGSGNSGGSVGRSGGSGSSGSSEGGSGGFEYSSGGGGGGGGGSTILLGGGGVGESPDDGDSIDDDPLVTPPDQVIDPDLLDALNLLNGSSAGQYYYDLIQAKQISVFFDDFSKYDVSDGVFAFWWGTARNNIYINDKLKGAVVESAIASAIAHEATHADYSYNPEKLIASTLERHPELSRADLNIQRDGSGNEIIVDVYGEEKVLLFDSIDQEYTAFANQSEVWKEIRGNDREQFLDSDLFRYEQGEAFLKTSLRTRPSYVNLPEY